MPDSKSEIFERFLTEANKFNTEPYRWKDRQFLTWIERNPQRIADGRLGYLIGSGYAASLLTGIRRAHSDLDLIQFDLP